MTPHQATFARLAPELNPAHVENLAIMAGSTLDGMPREFFATIAALARKMGAERLQEWHEEARWNEDTRK